MVVNLAAKLKEKRFSFTCQFDLIETVLCTLRLQSALTSSNPSSAANKHQIASTYSQSTYFHDEITSEQLITLNKSLPIQIALLGPNLISLSSLRDNRLNAAI